MPWFRLDDQGAFHEKVIQAGNEAYGAWVRAGQWSSSRGTEGFIPRATAMLIAGPKVWQRLIEAKGRSTVGLVEPVGDDFQIHDFLDYNPTIEEVLDRRATRAEAGRRGGLRSGATRRAKAHAKQSTKQLLHEGEASGEAIGQATAEQERTPIPIPIPIPRETKTPGAPKPGEAKPSEPPPPPPPPAAAAPEDFRTGPPVPLASAPPPASSSPPRFSRMEDPFWRDAYAETVRETLGAPWAFPDKQLSGLRRAVEGHCTTPGESDAWIRREVAAFVRAVRPRATFWSSFGPDGFLRWLNGGRPSETESAPSLAASAAAPTGNATQRKPAIHKVLGDEPAPVRNRPREAPEPPRRRPLASTTGNGCPTAPEAPRRAAEPPPSEQLPGGRA